MLLFHTYPCNTFYLLFFVVVVWLIAIVVAAAQRMGMEHRVVGIWIDRISSILTYVLSSFWTVARRVETNHCHRTHGWPFDVVGRVRSLLVVVSNHSQRPVCKDLARNLGILEFCSLVLTWKIECFDQFCQVWINWSQLTRRPLASV